MRAFELGAVLGWEKSRLSHHVQRMAQRGLVRKEKCASDRRGSFVSVTAAGRNEIEAAAPGHVNAVRTLFVDLLTDEQLDAIADAAEAVWRRSRRRRGARLAAAAPLGAGVGEHSAQRRLDEFELALPGDQRR